MDWRNDPKKVKIKVFSVLCGSCTDFMYGWVPCPCTYISWKLKISLYKCRKAMKKLVEEGIAIRESVPSCSVYGNDTYFPVNGFLVTEKGRQTGIYKYKLKQEERYLREAYGWDIDL